MYLQTGGVQLMTGLVVACALQEMSHRRYLAEAHNFLKGETEPHRFVSNSKVRTVGIAQKKM